MIAQRRDGNEPTIVQALERCGAYVARMDKSVGFDLLAVGPRGTYVIEVKDPLQRWKLTPNEAAVKAEIELCGGAYFVIETIDEAVGLAMDDRETVRALLEKELPCPG